MKVVALGFLVGATVLFLFCRWAEANGAGEWAGYVAAASEAGMVGALADWFAVTALFKHPLGIPIPHTAIIKRKKAQLGEGLGSFVRENFMSPEVIETKLRDAEVAGRLGKWLAEPAHAERVAAEASTVLRVLVEMLRDEDVQAVLDRMIVKRIAEPQWGPPIGRVLSTLLQEGRQEALLQLLADRAFQWSLNAGEVIERVIERDSPTWSPRWVDSLIGDRIHRELMDFTDKVRRNPDHELRRSATKFLFEFAEDLQHDETTIGKAENVKNQIMARDEDRPRRRDRLEHGQAHLHGVRRRPVVSPAHPHRRLRGAHRRVAARRRRSARQGRQLDHQGGSAPGRPNMGRRSQRSSPTRSNGGTPTRPAGASNFTSAVTCNSSESTAPWWVRWPA